MTAELQTLVRQALEKHLHITDDSEDWEGPCPRITGIERAAEAVAAALSPRTGMGARTICEALGFDPTNHHNAARCPYCTHDS